MSEAAEPIVETRKIPVLGGQILEVQMTQRFIDHLRQHFGIFGDQRLEDDHVKSYVLGAVDTAVAKAELDEITKATAVTA